MESEIDDKKSRANKHCAYPATELISLPHLVKPWGVLDWSLTSFFSPSLSSFSIVILISHLEHWAKEAPAHNGLMICLCQYRWQHSQS